MRFHFAFEKVTHCDTSKHNVIWRTQNALIENCNVIFLKILSCIYICVVVAVIYIHILLRLRKNEFVLSKIIRLLYAFSWMCARTRATGYVLQFTIKYVSGKRSSGNLHIAYSFASAHTFLHKYRDRVGVKFVIFLLRRKWVCAINDYA